MFESGRLYIDGVLRGAENGATYEDIGPWTGESIGSAADASAADVLEAIAAARRAFDETEWSRDKALRRDFVVRFAEGLMQERERLHMLAQHEVGVAKGALGSQVDRPLGATETILKFFDSYEWTTAMAPQEAFGVRSDRMIVREPVGVVGAITPWNVPLSIAMGKLVPALLAGCTVILKPAPETPLISGVLGEVAHRVGFPAGVFNVITGRDPAMAGEMLVTDKRVDLISFTGSTPVGKRIMEKGAPTLKRVFLELGGKSANIIFADTPNFANVVARGTVCFHAGQGCAITTRMLVQRSRYDEAIAVLKSAYEELDKNWGDIDAAGQVMGPVISARQRDRVMSYIEIGKAEGARLLAGGKAVEGRGGYFIEPTCFVDVTNDMRIAREEIFGPVLVVIPFEDEADAIRIANDSDYGLSGGVNSGDPKRAMRVAGRIRSGTMSVNGGVWSGVDMPFGGYKQSGIGREWGVQGFEEFLETKAIGIGVNA